MTCAAFFARQKPVSTKANPACMNMTRKPVTRVQTILVAIWPWPIVSRAFRRSALVAGLSLLSVSFLRSSALKAAPPPLNAFAAAPVADPPGSGLGSSAHAATLATTVNSVVAIHTPSRTRATGLLHFSFSLITSLLPPFAINAYTAEIAAVRPHRILPLEDLGSAGSIATMQEARLMQIISKAHGLSATSMLHKRVEV